jgi:hypothetical protein
MLDIGLSRRGKAAGGGGFARRQLLLNVVVVGGVAHLAYAGSCSVRRRDRLLAQDHGERDGSFGVF